MDSPIRTYLEAKQMTAAAFADLIGVKKAAVSKWMRGQGPSIESAKLIEERTNGDLPKEALRPDVWQPADHTGAA